MILLLVFWVSLATRFIILSLFVWSSVSLFRSNIRYLFDIFPIFDTITTIIIYNFNSLPSQLRLPALNRKGSRASPSILDFYANSRIKEHKGAIFQDQFQQFILCWMSDLRQSFQEEHCFSKVSLANFGFQLCHRSKLLRQLYSIKPTGNTSCLHDAIRVSLQNIRGLYQMIEQSHRERNWKLVNVIICNGKDDCSKNSWQQVKQYYLQTKNRIKTFDYKTVFIAYNVTPEQYSELLYLDQLDPANIPIYPASYFHNDYEELNLGKLMKKVRKDVGLLFKQPRESDLFSKNEVDDEDEGNPYGVADMKFSYGVLFTVNLNNEYNDQIWNSICNHINNFTRYLGDRDILGGILFNETVKYFKEEKFVQKEEKKKLIAPPPPPPAPPIPVTFSQPAPAPLNPPYSYNPGYVAQSIPQAPNVYPQNAGYIPPPYIPSQPVQPVRLPNNSANPPRQAQATSNKSKNTENSIPINQSLSSNNTIERRKPAVTQSQFLQSKTFSLCETGSKCRSVCGCVLTIFAIIIIGGTLFLVLRD